MKVTTLASTIPLSIFKLVSGDPQRAFPYSVIEPVTLLPASTFRSSMTTPAPGAAAVPHLPAIPLDCPNADIATRQVTAMGMIMYLSFLIRALLINPNSA
jgi:hypothetical protein